MVLNKIKVFTFCMIATLLVVCQSSETANSVSTVATDEIIVEPTVFESEIEKTAP
ncbi:MAG: hypothetical protein R3Y53_01455 [Bacillota bacterium]